MKKPYFLPPSSFLPCSGKPDIGEKEATLEHDFIGAREERNII